MTGEQWSRERETIEQGTCLPADRQGMKNVEVIHPERSKGSVILKGIRLLTAHCFLRILCDKYKKP
jgi:hypothetical protein